MKLLSIFLNIYSLLLNKKCNLCPAIKVQPMSCNLSTRDWGLGLLKLISSVFYEGFDSFR